MTFCEICTCRIRIRPMRIYILFQAMCYVHVILLRILFGVLAHFFFVFDAAFNRCARDVQCTYMRLSCCTSHAKITDIFLFFCSLVFCSLSIFFSVDVTYNDFICIQWEYLNKMLKLFQNNKSLFMQICTFAMALFPEY